MQFMQNVLWVNMQTNQTAIEKIAIAMKISGVSKMTEGAMYWALFQQGMGTDEATAMMKHAETSGVIVRKNYIVGLAANDEKNPNWERPVCNS